MSIFDCDNYDHREKLFVKVSSKFDYSLTDLEIDELTEKAVEELSNPVMGYPFYGYLCAGLEESENQKSTVIREATKKELIAYLKGCDLQDVYLSDCDLKVQDFFDPDGLGVVDGVQVDLHIKLETLPGFGDVPSIGSLYVDWDELNCEIKDQYKEILECEW